MVMGEAREGQGVTPAKDPQGRSRCVLNASSAGRPRVVLKPSKLVRMNCRCVMTRKTDSELSPAKRPRCPRCKVRMITNGVSERPNGSKHCVFECLKCGHIENNAVASDPPNNAEGSLSGEVGRHAVTYEIKEGRLVPKVTTLGPEGPSFRPCGRLLPASGR